MPLLKERKIVIKSGYADYTFNYQYSMDTIFRDLLEYISMICPTINICYCSKIKYYYGYYNNKVSIYNQDEKLYDVLSDFNNYKDYFEIIEEDNCKCDDEEKEYYKKPKLYFYKKVRNLEKTINEINEKNKKIYLENKKLNDILKKLGNNDPKIMKKIRDFNFNDLPDSDSNVIIGKDGQYIGNENTIYKDSIEFYDVIVGINSIKDICKGWEIKMSKRAQKNYQEFKNNKIIKIGVIGNSNKGKSFLLSKISKIKLPSGTSIRTEGLSIKYPELELYTNRKIALLDSAGLETPVLKEEGKKKSEKNENTDGNEEKENGKNENEKNQKDKESSNKNFEERYKNEKFKEKSREKIITELFLQNYIINNSDILIVVVGILTYSEQKLLNRIKTEMIRAKINKPLYIIHNLKTFVTKDQVEKYIKDYLLKSATFDLEEQEKISTGIKIKTGVNYYEKNSQPPIFHLIFANEGSAAGKYYNEFTLDYIEHTYQTVKDLTSFDVVATIRDRFKEISKEIIEKTEQNIEFDNIECNKYIRIKKPEKIILKKCLIDELGFSNLKANGFEPNYNYYKKDNKIIVRIEAPGNCSINSSVDYTGEYTIIRLSGKKTKDKEPEKIEDNIFNSRELGEFSLDIPLKTDDFLIKNEEPEYEKKNGLFFVTYILDKKRTGKTFEPTNEDV